MSVTQSQVGTLYIPRYNNIAWTQPLGPGTTVYPQQNNGAFANYPIPGLTFVEAGCSLWLFGCGHGADVIKVFRDYDASTGTSAAVCCCPMCSYLSRIIEPYEMWTDSTQYPILIP